MRQITYRQAPRPIGPAAAAFSKMLSRAWSLPPQRNFVAIERNVQVPMSDGTVLLADHYLPITSQPAATVLVRCPYGRGAPFSLLQAQLVAERGFHVGLQSVRGTFGSGGQFEPMRREARADSTDGWPRSAPATSASGSGPWPWTRRPSWSPRSWSSARTTSAGPRTGTAPSTCTTSSAGAT
jgi:predicted acyl esterase